MNLFGKKKTENWILKLFKITDRESARKFDMENCILSAIDFVSQQCKLKPTFFDINYKSSAKTLNGFRKALKNQKEIVYCFVGFDSNTTNTFFTISNPMLNWTEQPENSSIDFSVQIAYELIEKNYIEQLAEDLIKVYEFEYGYSTKLPSDYDSSTERKINKGLFSFRVDINEIDHAWTFHSVGILDGFIKSIYPSNYLNRSHFKDLATKELISNYGIVKKITENIYRWTLNSSELQTLKSQEQIEKISIVTTGLTFLKSAKAKVFNDKMKLKKAGP